MLVLVLLLKAAGRGGKSQCLSVLGGRGGRRQYAKVNQIGQRYFCGRTVANGRCGYHISDIVAALICLRHVLNQFELLLLLLLLV